MVYRGRPSTGCSRCRSRKIKCDERLKGCVKCIERGFTCPGYDRTVDAFFRDETANVHAKAKKAKAKAIAARDQRDAHDMAVLPITARGSPAIHLTAPLVDQGINFFMSHHALGLDQPLVSTEACHMHLATHGFHPLVATTMTALGIAGIANLYMDPDLKCEATRWYLKAIKMANAAISSPEDVRNDSTLVAVNLLSLFEATSNDNSLLGWSSHVDGAALLVKIRGMSQFSTPAGRRMYLHTIGLLTMNHMSKGVPMPEYVRDLNDEVMGYLNMDDPRNAFFFLQIKTNDLRAHILGQEMPDLRNIIDRAVELDTIAASIFHNAGEDWQYDTVPCPGDIPGVFGDEYHVYPTQAAAQTWNWVRYNRIYYHDIIRNNILAGLATSPPILVGSKYIDLLRKSIRMLYRLQSVILASMPQYLHDTPKIAPRRMGQSDLQKSPHPNTACTTPPSAQDISAPPISLITPPSSPTPSKSSSRSSHPTPGRKLFFQNFQTDAVPSSNIFAVNDSITERLPIVRISGGYSTLWSLYVAGSMPTASPASQDFVLDCFNRVEREFGINQAKILANALRIKRQMINGAETVFSLCPLYMPPDAGQNIPWQEPDSKVVDLSDSTSHPNCNDYSLAGETSFSMYDAIGNQKNDACFQQSSSG